MDKAIRTWALLLSLLAFTVGVCVGVVASPADAATHHRKPSCVKVWKVGHTLPTHYRGCRDTSGHGFMEYADRGHFMYQDLTTMRKLNADRGGKISRGWH